LPLLASPETSPFDKDKVFAAVLAPAINEWHFAAGGGYKLTENWEVSLSARWDPRMIMTESGKGDLVSQSGAGTRIKLENYFVNAAVTWSY